MITLGMTLIGRGNWSGGETYQRNMLGAIATQLAGKVQVKLFLSPTQHQRIGDSFDAFLACPAIVDPLVEGAGEGKRAVQALLSGADKGLAGLVQAHGVDVMFESAQWFGARFPVPVISWIPDFQHRHLKHLFSMSAWAKRDFGFHIQTGGNRVIMLSSQDSERDCLHFYPSSRGKTQVVRFAIDLDPAAVFARAQGVRETYGLPDKFFYLPNQFWSHKNHELVVGALEEIARAGQLGQMPPVILTGRTEDPRDPQLYARMQARVAAAGLEGHFRHLGLVPYADVFALNAAAHALVNPSLFEGWSTTVEEAKALGTPMILSGIGLHREQAPDARFVDPHQPRELADAFLARAQESMRTMPDLDALRADQMVRRKKYGEAIEKAVLKALEKQPARAKRFGQ